MIPVQDSTHKAEMLALLTDMFKKQPNIEGILSCLSVEVQTIEDQLYVYLQGIILATGTGDVLDKYGAIVGLPREGQTDTDYLIAILLEIQILRSQGRAEDVIKIVASVLTTFDFEEWQPAGWTVLSYNVANVLPILHTVGRAKAAGTRGVFLYTTWDPSTDIVFDSTTGSVPDARGFMDLVSGLPAYVMISAQDFKE